MTRGRLFLVPNLLGTNAPEQVLPARTLEIARGLAHWIVETPKPARAFLKSLEPAQPIAGLSIRAISEATDRTELAALLAPTREGHDIGLLSDAGCPGIADPGANLVATAHENAICVVPLVGPSSLLLALMASGMNGQRFTFHGYLPAKSAERADALRKLESQSRNGGGAQLFIETPYRNVAMLATLVEALAPATRVCVAVDLTLPGESVLTCTVREWRGRDFAGYAKRPAIFLLDAGGNAPAMR